MIDLKVGVEAKTRTLKSNPESSLRVGFEGSSI